MARDFQRNRLFARIRTPLFYYYSILMSTVPSYTSDILKTPSNAQFSSSHLSNIPSTPYDPNHPLLSTSPTLRVLFSIRQHLANPDPLSPLPISKQPSVSHTPDLSDTQQPNPLDITEPPQSTVSFVSHPAFVPEQQPLPVTQSSPAKSFIALLSSSLYSTSHFPTTSSISIKQSEPLKSDSHRSDSSTPLSNPPAQRSSSIPLTPTSSLNSTNTERLQSHTFHYQPTLSRPPISRAVITTQKPVTHHPASQSPQRPPMLPFSGSLKDSTDINPLTRTDTEIPPQSSAFSPEQSLLEAQPSQPYSHESSHSSENLHIIDGSDAEPRSPAGDDSETDSCYSFL